MLDGLISAIEARENKTKNKNQATRLDNARCHLRNAIDEIKQGFFAIEQFDKEDNQDDGY